MTFWNYVWNLLTDGDGHEAERSKTWISVTVIMLLLVMAFTARALAVHCVFADEKLLEMWRGPTKQCSMYQTEHADAAPEL